MWADLAIAAVAFTFGIFVHFYLGLRKPFSLHLRFPSGQILAFGLPTEHWKLANGEEPLRLELHDDGKPPQVPPSDGQVAVPQPAQVVPS